jgi:cytochrome bd-type quinol oxidase subunit 2
MNKLVSNVKKTLIWNASKIYTINYLVLLFSSLVYGVYIFVLKLSKNINFESLLKSNPYTSIMFVVILLNLLVGYILWMNSDINEQHYDNKIFLSLGICQLLLGNIFSFITFISTFFVLKNSEERIIKKNLIALFLSILLYLICFILLLRMIIK